MLTDINQSLNQSRVIEPDQERDDSEAEFESGTNIENADSGYSDEDDFD